MTPWVYVLPDFLIRTCSTVSAHTVYFSNNMDSPHIICHVYILAILLFSALRWGCTMVITLACPWTLKPLDTWAHLCISVLDSSKQLLGRARSPLTVHHFVCTEEMTSWIQAEICVPGPYFSCEEQKPRFWPRPGKETLPSASSFNRACLTFEWALCASPLLNSRGSDNSVDESYFPKTLQITSFHIPRKARRQPQQSWNAPIVNGGKKNNGYGFQKTHRRITVKGSHQLENQNPELSVATLRPRCGRSYVSVKST